MKSSGYRTLAILAAFICLALSPSACNSQSPSNANMRDLVQRQVGWDDALPNQKNPTGLHFTFTKIDETPSRNGRLVRYRVYVPGASEKKTYTLGTWKIGSELHVLPIDVYVNAKGLLMVHKPTPEQENSDSVADADELDLATVAARGEPVRFVLATEDGKFMVPGTVVPFPISGSGTNCRIEARLVQPDGQAILLYADGLPPNSVIPFKAFSEGDTETPTFATNAAGHAATIDMPFVDGKDSGTLKVAIDSKGCSTSLEIPWGIAAYHVM